MSILNRVSEQQIYIDVLHPSLRTLHTEPSLGTREYAPGDCDFNPFLKYNPQSILVRVIVGNRELLRLVDSMRQEKD